MKQRLGDDRILALQLVVAMIVFMWALEAVDYVAPGAPLDNYGIHPREPGGLLEILSAPFLHVGFGHLISNTVPFAVDGRRDRARRPGARRARDAHRRRRQRPRRVAHRALQRGAPRRERARLRLRLLPRRPAASSAGGSSSSRSASLVAGVWGIGLLQGLLPQERISWQAHLFGAVGGVVAAYYLAGARAGRERARASLTRRLGADAGARPRRAGRRRSASRGARAGASTARRCRARARRRPAGAGPRARRAAPAGRAGRRGRRARRRRRRRAASRRGRARRSGRRRRRRRRRAAG